MLFEQHFRMTSIINIPKGQKSKFVIKLYGKGIYAKCLTKHDRLTYLGLYEDVRFLDETMSFFLKFFVFTVY